MQETVDAVTRSLDSLTTFLAPLTNPSAPLAYFLKEVPTRVLVPASSSLATASATLVDAVLHGGPEAWAAAVVGVLAVYLLLVMLRNAVRGAFWVAKWAVVASVAAAAVAWVLRAVVLYPPLLEVGKTGAGKGGRSESWW
ncbi:hypothetical protein DFJ73DRAFT_760335 [Zopfochytrium polystomum]|nr:hypothetical protein DFJ73DRAFT_760335 [Zopfochytrium polystomum]